MVAYLQGDRGFPAALALSISVLDTHWCVVGELTTNISGWRVGAEVSVHVLPPQLSKNVTSYRPAATLATERL